MKYAVLDKHEGKRVSTHGSYALAKAKASKLHDKQHHDTATMNRYVVIPADAEAGRMEQKLAAMGYPNAVPSNA